MNISNRTFGNKMFWINKRLFDIVVCLLLIPLLLGVGIGVLNQVMRSKQLRV